MSATIRRGTPTRRPPARRKPAKVSLVRRLLGSLPVTEAMLRRGATVVVLLAGGAMTVAAAGWLGVPAMVGNLVADATARAGLRVETVEVTGNKRVDLMTVNALALDQKSRAMLAVDLGAIRQRLVDHGGWIGDAHVSRRLPDTLLIHIDERVPAAVWQDQGQLRLIDASGVLLDYVDAEHMPDLPLVIGPGADRQEAGYQALLAAAPALRKRVRAATWVGNRRWDLTFDTGEVLALPEGDQASAVALARFAAVEGARPVLGRGWLRFDMRDPAKLVARRPGSATQALTEPEGQKGPAAAPPAGDARMVAG